MHVWELINKLISCMSQAYKNKSQISTNKRPIGLIAPPFKINFLATEN